MLFGSSKATAWDLVCWRPITLVDSLLIAMGGAKLSWGLGIQVTYVLTASMHSWTEMP